MDSAHSLIMCIISFIRDHQAGPTAIYKYLWTVTARMNPLLDIRFLTERLNLSNCSTALESWARLYLQTW